MKNKLILTIGSIITAIVTGLGFQLFSVIVDHPIEQVAEKLLEENGIDIDFSKDKKNK